MAANIGNGPHSFIEDREVTRPYSRRADHRPWRQPRRRHHHGHQEVMAARPHHGNAHDQGLQLDRGESATSRSSSTTRRTPCTNPSCPNPKFTGSPYGKYGDFIQELDWSVGAVARDAGPAQAGRKHARHLHQRQRRRGESRATKMPPPPSRPAWRSTARFAAASTANGKAASASRSSSAGLAKSPLAPSATRSSASPICWPRSPAS